MAKQKDEDWLVLLLLLLLALLKWLPFIVVPVPRKKPDEPPVKPPETTPTPGPTPGPTIPPTPYVPPYIEPGPTPTPTPGPVPEIPRTPTPTPNPFIKPDPGLKLVRPTPNPNPIYMPPPIVKIGPHPEPRQIPKIVIKKLPDTLNPQPGVTLPRPVAVPTKVPGLPAFNPVVLVPVILGGAAIAGKILKPVGNPAFGVLPLFKPPGSVIIGRMK